MGVSARPRAVLAFPAIRVFDADLLQRAIEVREVHRLDFGDANLVARGGDHERRIYGVAHGSRGQARPRPPGWARVGPGNTHGIK